MNFLLTIMKIYIILYLLCLISLVFGKDKYSDNNIKKKIKCILHIKYKNNTKFEKCMNKYYYNNNAKRKFYNRDDFSINDKKLINKIYLCVKK